MFDWSRISWLSGINATAALGILAVGASGDVALKEDVMNATPAIATYAQVSLLLGLRRILAGDVLPSGLYHSLGAAASATAVISLGKPWLDAMESSKGGFQSRLRACVDRVRLRPQNALHFMGVILEMMQFFGHLLGVLLRIRRSQPEIKRPPLPSSMSNMSYRLGFGTLHILAGVLLVFSLRDVLASLRTRWLYLSLIERCAVLSPVLGHGAVYIAAARSIMGHRGIADASTTGILASSVALGVAPLALVSQERWGLKGSDEDVGIVRSAGWFGAGSVLSLAILAALRRS